MGTYKENKTEFAPVLHYFREIAKIPRGSGNEAAISAYVEAFARERGYFCRRDEANNVFIRRDAAPDTQSMSRLYCRVTWIWCARQTQVSGTIF